MSNLAGAGARPYDFTADGTAYTGKGRLVGYRLIGGTAAVVLYDNTAASGTKLVDTLSTAAEQWRWFDEEGIAFNTGVTVDVGAGFTSGTLYLKV